ncbi:hypothetical protein HYALB_00009305 [Hymenoscyphus albidus]|uniref:Uncharacterized protein n=1 Tax=Hymenoscyphus albidus TaxID=595503 RepID=A0A9N9LCB8_9HELO|nr:hypothetical protein HYALB_00009305 [Hymenoscyphus albidus]
MDLLPNHLEVYPIVILLCQAFDLASHPTTQTEYLKALNTLTHTLGNIPKAELTRERICTIIYNYSTTQVHLANDESGSTNLSSTSISPIGGLKSGVDTLPPKSQPVLNTSTLTKTSETIPSKKQNVREKERGEFKIRNLENDQLLTGPSSSELPLASKGNTLTEIIEISNDENEHSDNDKDMDHVR